MAPTRPPRRTAALRAGYAPPAQISTGLRSQHLAQISHEIRTPLHTIIALARQLAAEAAPRSADPRLRQLDASAEHLLGIVNDVLDLANAESGRLQLERLPLDVPALLRETVDIVAPRAAAAGLAISVECRLAQPLRLGDPTRLRQMLLNLLCNAIKFTPSGSIRVIVGTPRALSVPLLRFEVIDTGIGIDADVLPRLFEPYVQADASTARCYGGTGLGLAIVRNLAQLMDGRVGCHSTPGRGSRFWFTAHMPAVDAPAPRTAASGGFSRRRVLLADDDALCREIAQAMLESMGIAVTAVADGPAALAAAARQRFDLVMLDMCMPGLDGAATCRALREQAPTPVLVTSGMEACDARDALQGLPAVHWLAKPVQLDALRGALERCWAAEPPPAQPG